MSRDLRLSIRQLRKNPGFSFSCIVALALGIGANTAIFSMVNAVLLRPLTFRNPQELVWIWSTRTDRDKAFFSIPDFVDYREQNTSLREMAAFANWGANLAEGTSPERLTGIRVTPNAFAMLGTQPAIGRCLQADDAKPGSQRTVVLSYRLWQKRFAGAPGIVGKDIRLNGDSYSVVGVLPEAFVIPNAEIDIATPLVPETDPRRTDRGANFLRVFARMKAGYNTRQVQSEMNSIALDLQHRYPEENAKKTPPRVFLLQDETVGSYRTSLFMLLGSVGLVLLIACSNLANLLLSRASARRKEMAVRAALGASRFQSIKQLLTETGVLVFIGAASGLFLAWYGLQFLIALSPETLPRAREVGIDGRALVFTLLASSIAGAIFGVIPALRASKVDLNQDLVGSGKGTADAKGSDLLRSVLVISEIALSLVLLITAALLMKSFLYLQAVNPGFKSENVLAARLSLPAAKYRNAEAMTVFFDKVLSRIGTIPGVESVGAVNVLPLSGMNTRSDFTISGRPPLKPSDKPAAQSRWVTPDYFRALGVRLIKGRPFNPHDNAGSGRVAVIDEALARRYWPASDPLGSHLLIEDDATTPRDVEIIGVVETVKHFSLDEEALPTFYSPMAQIIEGQVGFVGGNCSLAIRTNQDPLALQDQVRREVQSVDPEVPFSNPKTMDQALSASTAARRFILLLVGIFSGAAVLLAISGVYAVISYSVTRRQQEIGIRIALGARSIDVMKLVLGQGTKLVSIGIIAGILAAILATRLVSSLLFGMSPIDPITFAAASLLLSIVAICGCYIPARRAIKTNPVIALRGD
jgi:predicted permease